MKPPQPYQIYGQQLWLSGACCVYWEEAKALILSDLHLGKTGHFRKEGIAVPQRLYQDDLHRFFHVVQHFQPEKLIIVGDLFHSSHNKELDLFLKWRNNFSSLNIHLVMGNHDVLCADWYASANIAIHHHALRLQNFVFTHAPVEEADIQEKTFYFCGHLHPGIKLNGMGKQSLSFPCFYFSNHQCILPAFGKFTGLSFVRPKAGDKVFAVVNENVIPVA